MTRYQFNLSSQALLTAERELNEPRDHHARLAAIDNFRTKFKDVNPDLTLVREDDSYLLRFLRAKKFNLTEALCLLQNCCRQRIQWPEFYNLVDNPQLLEYELTVGVALPIQGKTKDNCGIFLTRFGKSKSMLINGLAATYVVRERLLEDEENQINGVIAIHDLAYASKDIYWEVNNQIVKKAAVSLNHSQPLRVRKVIIANQPAIFRPLYGVFSVFISEKMRDRIVVVGKNYSLLHEIVDSSLLPSSMKGSRSDSSLEEWCIKPQSPSTTT